MNKKILIVAFDGMDYELIQEYNCQNIIQSEFGKIDNNTGIHSRMTSELFASFITGKTHEEHGIKGLRYRDRKEYFLYSEKFRKLVNEVPGFHRLKNILEAVLGRNTPEFNRKYFKSDLNSNTIFDELEAAKPLFVPVTEEASFEWMCAMPNAGLEWGYSSDEVMQKSREYSQKRLERFWNLSFDFWECIMLHLHDPDTIQDLGKRDLREDYERLDDIAGEIKEEFDDEWTIIFMSDHGLKQEFQHNKNAFYSCNRKIFENQTPHITDFYSEIKESLGN